MPCDSNIYPQHECEEASASKVSFVMC